MKKAFTLIELLVVIAIIGILAAIALASFTTAQKQARDASRRAIITNIQTAFEQYNAVNGAYPSTAGQISSAFQNGAQPADPKPSTPLIWNVSAASYCVCATLETGVGNGVDPGAGTSCSWSSTGTYYCAQNKQ